MKKAQCISAQSEVLKIRFSVTETSMTRMALTVKLYHILLFITGLELIVYFKLADWRHPILIQLLIR